MHLNSAAWRSAVNVGTSLLKASVSNQEIYPQAHFPFEGVSTLTASGKWLSFSGKPHATFLVYSLRSCSHPFPFRSLRYEVKARCIAPAKMTSQNETRVPQLVKSPRRTSDPQLVEQDASEKFTRQARLVWAAQRFTDLTKKTIWKNRVLSVAPSGAVIIPGAASDTNSAVGETGSDRRVRSVDLQIRTENESEFPIPEFLKEIVDELKDLKDCKVELLTASAEDGWTIPLLVSTDEEGEINPGLFVEIGGNQLRERRIASFSITNNKTYFIVVAIESDPAYSKIYPMHSESESSLQDTLRRAAADFISKDRDTHCRYAR
ncbi:MAG: hypothetical protein JWQ21_837 [Herminiimonas sp.]|nr:hypothetical protein [Herminiimonas sp.]